MERGNTRIFVGGPKTRSQSSAPRKKQTPAIRRGRLRLQYTFRKSSLDVLQLRPYFRMKKSLKILLALFFPVLFSSCSNNEDFNFSGESNYSKTKNHSLTSSFSANYKLKIKTLSSTSIDTYLSGSTNPEYDHFLNEVKVNTFTGIHIEF